MAIQEEVISHNNTLQSVLTHVKERGVPVRIDDASGSYYVLSAKQLMFLLQERPLPAESAAEAELDDTESFTPEDFGLTEAEVAAYEQRHNLRRMMLNSPAPIPMSQELEEQLQQITQRQNAGEEVDEKILNEVLHNLESSMLQNLNAIITVAD